MVSALRQRAARQSADPAAASTRPPVVDDSVEFTTPLRAGRPPSWRAKRRWNGRGLWRRFGLAVSIAGAMVASAIGGALLVSARPASVAALPASPVAASAPIAAPHRLAAASAPVAPAHAVAEAASAPVEEAHAASAAAVAVASPPPASAPDLTFGLDLNGDGIPDSLERFVRKTINTPATRVAARHYYRIALPMATRVQQGELLPHADKESVFRAAECYFLSAAEDGLTDPPNLNDRAMLIGTAAADRIQALTEALQGFDYRVGGKRQSCG